MFSIHDDLIKEILNVLYEANADTQKYEHIPNFLKYMFPIVLIKCTHFVPNFRIGFLKCDRILVKVES